MQSPTLVPYGVTVSMRRMSLGTGYEYLMRSVARGDLEAAASTPLTRYYAESGTPPGRFVGAGLAGLGDGAGVAAGSVVSERDLFRLLGMMQDPLTGRPLGAAPMAWRTGSAAQPVAGFDLTFSVPKSVSVVWALADPETQAVIYRAHLDAIDEAITWAERHVFFSRSGHGGAVREQVRGVVATAFDHWDSRAGDPHLHTHVVVANRAQSVSDGRWRSLDSRTLFGYVVALSELHEGVLQDLLTARLGYGWDERTRAHSAVPRWDIAGVPEALIGEFSRRSAHIDEAMTGLVEGFAEAHGRQPSRVEMLRLRQQATLSTRPVKQQHSLFEQTEQWRAKAASHLPVAETDTGIWVGSLRDRSALPALPAESIDAAMLGEIAALALHTVGSKRATFSAANVLAEVHRQLHGARFATPTDRLTVADHTTTVALEQALVLTPADMERVSSRAAIYSTREILDAETRLLDAARDTTAPRLPVDVIHKVVAGDHVDGTGRLTDEQAGVVHAIGSSGRVLDLLVGPAGAGKTRTLAALRAAWEQAHGPDSVVGLAPSAAAADVLAAGLGIGTENTAKWLHEHARQDDRLDRLAVLIDRLHTSTSSPSTVLARQIRGQIAVVYDEYRRWEIRPGQLVIIDEASLAGTLTLDTISTEAREAGAKVLLVGDWAQLGAIEAGGAFAMLTHDRADVPELNQIHRFTNGWERDATTRLRVGDPAVIDTYLEHDRIRSGDREQLLDTLYTAWRQDTQQGLASVMIAADRESVADLSHRAQADRIIAGEVSEHQVETADGTAGAGDQIVTRHNDRTLRTPGGWVKNGDTFTITATRPDGSLRVHNSGSGEVVLSAEYVREHVELGYATTTHRVQGRTVDTAHALVSPFDTREVLYVAATRGRHANTLYVNTADTIADDSDYGSPAATPAAEVLRQVLDRTGVDMSAHAILERERANDYAFAVDAALGIPTIEPIEPLRAFQRSTPPPDLSMQHGIEL